MKTLSLIALIAATATPALATIQPIDATPTSISARDIADRAEGFEVSELFGSERAGDPTTRNRDIADRADGFEISELFGSERAGLPGARDIADRADGYQVSELFGSERGGLLRNRDIADRADGYQISELSADERNGLDKTAARDIGDRQELPFA